MGNMGNEQILKEAINYQIEVAKWVKEVFKWHKEQSEIEAAAGDGGSNPPPPPPPPPGT